MKLMKKDIRANEMITSFFALESMQLRKSKTQQHFLAIELYDKSGKIKGYLWTDPIEMAAFLKVKSYVKIRGITKEINGSIVIDIEKIRAADKSEVDIRDFLDVVPGGIDYWHKRLLTIIESVKDTNCRNLIFSFLYDEGFLEMFITSPGGLSVHHNYIGGLLEHTVNIMEQALAVASRHEALLDTDLLLTAAFIHDIGKTREIYWEVAREYTTEGKLLGHIAIGITMIEEKLSKFPDFPVDLAMLLKHMILSHHGSLEYGSPVVPATPEAVALNLIDNIDAKLNHLYCHLGYSDPGDSWSGYDRFFGTAIYVNKYPREILEKKIGKAA
jgi:3'-5' exoribonuclease